MKNSKEYIEALNMAFDVAKKPTSKEYPTAAHIIFDAGIDFAMSQPKHIFDAGYNEAKRWIPVGERLPCENGHYLVKVEYSFPKNCKVVVSEFYYKEDGTGYFRSESTECVIEDVIEWREI